MVRKANKDKDLVKLAEMMRDMAKELFDDYAKDFSIYKDMILSHFNNENDIIYIDTNYNGFFIVRDETEPWNPNRKIANGIRVYIAPKARKTRLLKQFYDRLFNDFEGYEIWGVTEINSEHIKVMDKRHTLVAKVYKLKRR